MPHKQTELGIIDQQSHCSALYSQRTVTVNKAAFTPAQVLRATSNMLRATRAT